MHQTVLSYQVNKDWFVTNDKVRLPFSTFQQHGWLTHTHTQPFYSPFSGTTRVSQCQKKSSGLYCARGDIRGRHADHPAGRHSIQTNQQPTSLITPFLRRMPFLP